MAPPAHLFLSRTRKGKLRLHAENSINSMGRGPAELRGRRDGRYTMAARQVIYRTDGTSGGWTPGRGSASRRSPASTGTGSTSTRRTSSYGGSTPGGAGPSSPGSGPKQSYCLRDLQRRNPQLRRSPPNFHYPGCSQDLRRQRVTLGTSVGWSDVYPATYHEQWIDVTGLRGCFAYVHIADPKNGIYESNERNNAAETIVRLPWNVGDGRRGCPRQEHAPGTMAIPTEAPRPLRRRPAAPALGGAVACVCPV